MTYLRYLSWNTNMCESDFNLFYFRHLPNNFNETSEVCLFSKLPGKQVKEQLKVKGVTNITKVGSGLATFDKAPYLLSAKLIFSTSNSSASQYLKCGQRVVSWYCYNNLMQTMLRGFPHTTGSLSWNIILTFRSLCFAACKKFSIIFNLLNKAARVFHDAKTINTCSTSI